VVGELADEVRVVDARHLLGQPRRHQMPAAFAEQFVRKVGLIDR
jgi:hypothetical protein